MDLRHISLPQYYGERAGWIAAAACGGLVLNDYFLLTAFFALESAHLALQASREWHTLDKMHISFAARAGIRFGVGQWDVSKRRVTCVLHGALPPKHAIDLSATGRLPPSASPVV
jgi:hypothetical protein